MPRSHRRTFYHLEKQLTPALGSSPSHSAPGRILLLVHIRLKTCSLHFGSMLRNHKASQKANLATLPPAETLQQGPCPSHHGTSSPACLLSLPSRQPPHHEPLSCLWAFPHTVPSTLNAIPFPLRPCPLAVTVQTVDPQSPPLGSLPDTTPS